MKKIFKGLNNYTTKYFVIKKKFRLITQTCNAFTEIISILRKKNQLQNFKLFKILVKIFLEKTIKI